MSCRGVMGNQRQGPQGCLPKNCPGSRILVAANYQPGPDQCLSRKVSLDPPSYCTCFQHAPPSFATFIETQSKITISRPSLKTCPSEGYWLLMEECPVPRLRLCFAKTQTLMCSCFLETLSLLIDSLEFLHLDSRRRDHDQNGRSMLVLAA
jgi:hypothetical protein